MAKMHSGSTPDKRESVVWEEVVQPGQLHIHIVTFVSIFMEYAIIQFSCMIAYPFRYKYNSMNYFRTLWISLCVYLLVACTPATEPEDEQPLVPVTAAPTVSLSFGALEQHRTSYQSLIDRFNEQNPSIWVEFVAIDGILARTGNQGGATRAQAVAEAADISTILPLTVELQQQYLTNLAPLIDADRTFDQADFYPTVLEKQSNGAIYTLPQLVGVPVVAYNKDAWQQEIGPFPTQDWIQGNMLLAAFNLVEKSKTGISRYGMVDDGTGRVALALTMAQRDPTLRTTPIRDLKLNTPFMIGMYDALRSFQDGGLLYMSPSGGRVASPRSAITRGKIGMWPAGAISPQERLDFAVGYTAFPDIPLPFERILNGGAISRSSQHPEAAWRWLAFLSRQIPVEVIEEEPLLYLPARRSVAEQSGYWRQWNEEDAALIQQIAERTPEPVSALSEAPTWVWRITQSEFGTGYIPDLFEQAQQALEASLANASSPTKEASLRPVATPVAVPEEATHIMFAVNGGKVGLFSTVAEAFMRDHPEIFITVVEQVGGTADTIETLATTSDCFTTGELPTSETANRLLALDPLIDADASFVRADIPTGLMAPFTLEGRSLGIPYRFWPQVLAFNDVIFDKQGLPRPNADWSATTLLANAKELTQVENGVAQYGFAFQRGGSNIAQVLDWFGASLAKGEGEELAPTFTEPQTVSALQAYVALRQSSPEPAYTSYRADDRSASYAIQSILDGNVAMWFDRGLSVRESPNADETKLNIRLAPLPQFNATSSLALASPTGFYIAANSEHADTCWTWFKYLSQDVTAIDDGFPARQSVAESSTFIEQAPSGSEDVYAAYLPALQRTSQLSANMVILLTGDARFDAYWLEDAISRAVEGNDLADELQQAQQRTEAFLSCRENGGAAPDCAIQIDPNYGGWRNAKQ